MNKQKLIENNMQFFFLKKSFSREKQFLILFLLSVIGSILFLLLSLSIKNDVIQSSDKQILLWFRDSNNITQNIGPHWLTDIARYITAFGSETVLTVLIIIISVLFLLKRKYNDLYLVLTVSIGGFLIDIILKELIHRTRPDLVFHLVYVSSNSFPSGHSMMSATIYTSLALVFIREKEIKVRNIIFIIPLLITFLVGLSRIFLGVHYPSDVLAGWIAGFTWIAICWLVMIYFEEKKTNISISTL